MNTIITNIQFSVALKKMNELPFFVRNFRNKEKIRGKLNYLANTLVGRTTRSATKNNDKLKNVSCQIVVGIYFNDFLFSYVMHTFQNFKEENRILD